MDAQAVLFIAVTIAVIEGLARGRRPLSRGAYWGRLIGSVAIASVAVAVYQEFDAMAAQAAAGLVIVLMARAIARTLARRRWSVDVSLGMSVAIALTGFLAYPFWIGLLPDRPGLHAARRPTRRAPKPRAEPPRADPTTSEEPRPLATKAHRAAEPRAPATDASAAVRRRRTASGPAVRR